jgi:hypothetical protein
MYHIHATSYSFFTHDCWEVEGVDSREQDPKAHRISMEAAHTVNIICKLPCSGDHNWGRVVSKQQTGYSSGDHDPQLAKAWS